MGVDLTLLCARFVQLFGDTGERQKAFGLFIKSRSVVWKLDPRLPAVITQIALSFDSRIAVFFLTDGVSVFKQGDQRSRVDPPEASCYNHPSW